MSLTLQPPPTRSGLLPEARHLVLPDGIVATGFPAVERTCAAIGIEFDPWEVELNRCILAKGQDGDYAADTVAMSICRQAGKTFDVGALVFADSIIHPGTTTIWTAHRFKVARETFDQLRALAESPLLAPHIDERAITTGAGNETIPFRNGSRIVFAARERGSVRGFTKVRRLVLDEAQILTSAAMADVVPTMNQAVNPQIILMGTPPKPSDPCEVFGEMRQAALDGRSEGLLYVEFSADPEADPESEEAWRQANPSFPRRTGAKAILRLLKLLGRDDFRREGLGIWDEAGTGPGSVISSSEWSRPELVTDVAPAGPVAYGVKFSPDGMTVAVSVAVKPDDDGPIHVEGVFQRPMVDGTRWLIDWLAERSGEALAMVVDGRSGAGALVKGLRAAGVPARRITMPTVEQAITAHSMLRSAVIEGTLTHLDDPALAESVRSAGKRPIGNLGGWGFQSIDDGDVTLIESTVFAHFGAATARRGRNGPRRERRAVML